MSGGPTWPQPPRPQGAGAPRAPQTSAARAAALEAEAAALGQSLVGDLIRMLESVSAHAGEIAGLRMVSPEIASLSVKVQEEATSRAASFRQLANLPAPQAETAGA